MPIFINLKVGEPRIGYPAQEPRLSEEEERPGSTASRALETPWDWFTMGLSWKMLEDVGNGKSRSFQGDNFFLEVMDVPLPCRSTRAVGLH